MSSIKLTKLFYLFRKDLETPELMPPANNAKYVTISFTPAEDPNTTLQGFAFSVYTDCAQILAGHFVGNPCIDTARLLCMIAYGGEEQYPDFFQAAASKNNCHEYNKNKHVQGADTGPETGPY